MADNILRGIIKIEAPGVQQTFTQVASGVTKTEQSIRKISPVTNQANFALLNMGRVFQDLPFGIIGVANNINPLVESFQRLKAESAATGTTMRSALIGALRGGGGLGIAVSLLTSVLTFATVGLGFFGRGLFGAKKNADDTKDSVSGLTTSINQVGSEASRVTQLFNALAFGDLNARQTKSAIEELKKINFEYFGQLKDEENLVKDLKTAYDGYINSLSRTAQAKVLADRITKLFDKKIELQLSIAPQFTAQTSIETQKTIGRLTNQLNALGGPIDVVNEKFDAFNDKQRERARIQNQIRQLISGENVIFTEGTKEIQKQIDVIDLQIQGLLAFGNGLQLFETTIKTTGDAASKSIEQLGESLGDIGDLTEALDFDLQLNPIVDPTQLNTEINNALASRGGARVEVDADIRINPVLQKAKEDINRAIQDLAVESLSSFGDILGAALTGSDVGGAFKAFIGIVASGLTAIGKQMIILSPVIASLKAALKTLNPAVLLPAGVALVAIGAALRNSVGKGVEFRALGGPVSGRNPYVVGERGPELFIPSVSGSIIPNDRLGTVKSGSFGNWSGEVVFRIGNNELIGTLSKGQRSQNILV